MYMTSDFEIHLYEHKLIKLILRFGKEPYKTRRIIFFSRRKRRL